MRALIAGALAVAAVGLLAAKAGDLWAGYAAAHANQSLAAAQAAPRGPAREAALAKAHDAAQAALRISPRDPRLWNALAETRLLQASAREGGALSEPLLASSAQAAARASALAPHDGAPYARLAYVESLRRNAPAAAAAMKRSYAMTPSSPAFGLRRIETAGRAWSALDASARRDVLAEACMLASRSQRERNQLYAVRITYAEPGLALTLDEVLADPACRLPSSGA